MKLPRNDIAVDASGATSRRASGAHKSANRPRGGQRNAQVDWAALAEELEGLAEEIEAEEQKW